MNDMSFDCGKFAGSLRKQLFREHLGLLRSKDKINIDDIVKKSFYRDIWCERSKRNTEIYEEVFRCIPTDNVVNFSMLKIYQNETPLCSYDPDTARNMLDEIRVSI